MVQFGRGAVILHRDLRIHDNPALKTAIHECESVLLLFLINDVQISPANNPYFSANAFHFMLEALSELQTKTHGRLHVLHVSDVAAGVRKIATIWPFEALYYNRDYTPFARRREQEYGAVCDEIGAALRPYDGIVLVPPTALKPYKVFTPYCAAASKLIDVQRGTSAPPNLKKCVRDVRWPQNLRAGDLDGMLRQLSAQISPQKQRGTRAAALRQLRAARELQYAKTRNILALPTSRLSPYLKFGLISPAEAYIAAPDAEFRRQIHWRDFYLQLAYHFPHVLSDEHGPGAKSLRKIPKYWRSDAEAKSAFAAWCDGKTGVPLVDAAMRQLRQTGWMHNRARMVVSSYLVKDLHIDWTWGERYFARMLTDYDPASNSGGWQFALGMGAMPFFRKFSPTEQQKKYDPNGKYVATN